MRTEIWYDDAIAILEKANLMNYAPAIQCIMDGFPTYLHRYVNFETDDIEEIEFSVKLQNTNDQLTFKELMEKSQDIISFNHRVYTCTNHCAFRMKCQ